MFTLRSLTPARLEARWLWVGLALACCFWSGCQAITNPVAEGIPVRRLPPEFLGRPREIERPIPLALLGQRRPEEYEVGPGDVLGIWVEGVLGEAGMVPPVVPQTEAVRAPAIGFPVPVDSEGKLPLPYVKPIPVKGMTLAKVRQAIFYAYTVESKILKTGKERIFVTLVQPRRYHVLVVREDTGALTIGGTSSGQAGAFGNAKRGTGYTLELPAYENDVLNALTRTGGLPGLDATNEVFIEREIRNQAAVGAAAAVAPGCPPAGMAAAAGGTNKQIIRIPLRLPDGAPVPFTPQDVILGEGDIVRILARDRELFYTGGILPPGEHILPRDYDLDVLAAVLQVGGTLFNGNTAQNTLTGITTQSLLSNVNPSQLSVIRRTSDGRQVVIVVDLNRAAEDRRERILVQPGDVLVLQQTIGEALLSYVVPKLNFSLQGRPLTTTNPVINTGVTLP